MNIFKRLTQIEQRLHRLENPPLFKIGETVIIHGSASVILKTYTVVGVESHFTLGGTYFTGYYYNLFDKIGNRVVKDIRESEIELYPG